MFNYTTSEFKKLHFPSQLILANNNRLTGPCAWSRIQQDKGPNINNRQEGHVTCRFTPNKWSTTEVSSTGQGGWGSGREVEKSY